MSFTKYTKTEGDAKVLSPKAHEAASEQLRKQGKSSAKELSEQEREEFTSIMQSCD